MQTNELIDLIWEYGKTYDPFVYTKIAQIRMGMIPFAFYDPINPAVKVKVWIK